MSTNARVPAPMQITGRTELIAHLGWPTHAFKAPMIYNPYFQSAGVDAVVVPMGCKAEDFEAVLRGVFALQNVRGALITMPHKISVAALCDEITPAVQIAGACNAVRKMPDGRLLGDMFDGEGFVRGLKRTGCTVKGARALVVGAGGVGSAICASLAAAGIAALALFDAQSGAADALAARLRAHYPALVVTAGSKDPAGFDLVVNATPMGMSDGDPMPVDVDRIDPTALVGEVVMRQEITPLLRAALARGCRIQVGTDMLFEQIPAYLEFFGLPSTSADVLRSLAQLEY